MPTRMITLNQRKPKKKKSKVIPHDYEDLNYYIYNDLDIPYYIDDDSENEWKLEKLLLKGEIALPAPDVYSGFHFITNYGRVLNAKMVRWITINNVDNRYLIYHLDGKRWYLEKTFKQLGFKYDMKKLLQQYRKLDYPCRLNRYSRK